MDQIPNTLYTPPVPPPQRSEAVSPVPPQPPIQNPMGVVPPVPQPVPPTPPVSPVAPPYEAYDPYGYSHPGYIPPPPPPPSKPPAQGLAIASMILGIASFVLMCSSNSVSMAVPIVGLILGIIAKAKKNKTGFSTAGIICSAIALVLMILLFVFLFAFFFLMMEDSMMYDSYYYSF